MSDELRLAKAEFLDAGGNLAHKRVSSAMSAADDRARQEAQSASAPRNRAAADWIMRALGILAVAFVVVVMVVGVALLLVVIPMAEFEAVRAGLLAITPDKGGLATLTTAALFVGTLVMMYLKHVYEDALPNGKPATGLRRRAHAIGAWLGGRDSEAWIKDNAYTNLEANYRVLVGALSVAKFAILGASLVGRLGTAIAAHGSLALADSLESIRTTLTGAEAIDILVSLVVLFAMLKMLDMGVLFCYAAFKNSAGKLDIAEARPVDFLELYDRLSARYQAQALDDLTLQLHHHKSKNPPPTNE